MRHLEARLVRQVPVRLVEYSLSGCRIATAHPIELGAEGRLKIELDGKQYQDTVHIVRRMALKGITETMTIGGEFAWANRPGAVSIRGTVPSAGRGCHRQL